MVAAPDAQRPALGGEVGDARHLRRRSQRASQGAGQSLPIVDVDLAALHHRGENLRLLLRGAEVIADLVDQASNRKVGDLAHRSEEHTSELQSLMRISYAVFCLKKKK